MAWQLYILRQEKQKKNEFSNIVTNDRRKKDVEIP